MYAARCGIVHSYQAESKLSREGKAKQIWYAWGKGDVTRFMTKIHQANLNGIAVAVQIEELFKALEQGISNFLSSLDADPAYAVIVYDRAEKKLFSNISHEML